MHLHILGICGTFMGGIAQLAVASGHRVTGCDAHVYPPMSEQLTQLGIELIEGYAADQLALQPDLYVIGNAMSRGNPLVEAILNTGAPYTSGPEWLSKHILTGRWVLAVAGTHGKTTTSALLTWLLESAGHQPSFLIGGVPCNFSQSARLTNSPYFVIEADEYDTAFFDKRSKFVHYRPRTLILNNLEYDHADIFPDLAAIERQCHHLVRTLPSQGRIIVNAAVPALQRVLDQGCWTPTVAFNTPDSYHTEVDSGVWHMKHGSEHLGTTCWHVLGEHNRSNAVAAVLAAEHIGIPIADSLAALQHFQSVKRRLENLGRINGVTIYDDFAHHPTAIAATLEGLRSQVGTERIVAVFEPRSNTMKQGQLKNQLAASLNEADLVFCYTHQLGWDVGSTLAACTAPTVLSEDIPDLAKQIAEAARPGDHILIMSNGGFGGIHRLIGEHLSAHTQKISVPHTTP